MQGGYLLRSPRLVLISDTPRVFHRDHCKDVTGLFYIFEWPIVRVLRGVHFVVLVPARFKIPPVTLSCISLLVLGTGLGRFSFIV